MRSLFNLLLWAIFLRDKLKKEVQTITKTCLSIIGFICYCEKLMMPFRYTYRLLYTSVLFPVKFFVTVNLLYYLYIFPLEDESKNRDLSSVKCESLVGVQGSLFTQSLSNLKEVWRLDSLVRAHTLLAVMADKTSPEHQLNLLRAYTFVLRIWQVHCPITGNRQCGWGCSSNANYVWVEL